MKTEADIIRTKKNKWKSENSLAFTDGQRLFMCGELLPNKNQQMIIHAMQKIKNIRMHNCFLAGNGSEKEILKI